MKIVKCHDTQKFHLVHQDDNTRTKCGKKIENKLTKGWGVVRERDTLPKKKMCKMCER